MLSLPPKYSTNLFISILKSFFFDFVIAIAIIGFIIYIAVMIASVLAGIAGAGGLAWGGGTAIANYAKSFKENMIDSNKVTA